uniref:DNA-directed DNA polymerase n=1 Tax=Cacopsylla melanoneura TaxID=428564 RepID=A0A8D8QU03_9HEMI
MHDFCSFEKKRTHIKIPTKIFNRKVTVDHDVEDCYSFKYALLGGLLPKEEEIRSREKDFDNMNWDLLDFPVDFCLLSRFEEFNSIFVNVFGLNEKDEVVILKATSNSRYIKHVDLLFMTNNVCASRYYTITDLSKLLHPQITKDRTRPFFLCKACLTHFSSQEKFEVHHSLCSLYPPTRVELPSIENNILKFENFRHQQMIPYVIYADFECLLEKVDTCDLDPSSSYTNQIQVHTPFSFAYYIVGPDKDSCKFVTYMGKKGEDVVQIFLDFLGQEALLIEEKYKSISKIDRSSQEDRNRFNNAESCHQCGKVFSDSSDKCWDHDHMSQKGNLRFVLCKKCNFKYCKSDFIPIFLHNFTNYDCQLIAGNLGYTENKTHVIPLSEEKYISVIKNINSSIQLRFVDSYKFLAASLAELVGNLSLDQFHHLKENFPSVDLELLRRKQVFCYDYLDTYDKLKETSLPAKKDFFNRLHNKDISDEDYSFVQMVWEKFQIKSLAEFSSFYLKTDVLLLADCFQNFRSLCFSIYQLDPAWYFTIPGLAFDAMLYFTNIRLELLIDYDQVLFFEQAIIGGVSQCCLRYCEANNKYMGRHFNSSLPSSFISYLDCNGLYSWSMSLHLPTSNFKWLDKDELQYFNCKENILNIDEKFNKEKGFFFEITIDYPDHLHDSHQDLPFLPISQIPPNAKQRKLLLTLNRKEKYICHYKTLQTAIANGLVLVQVHRGISFTQSDWLKKFVDYNTIIGPRKLSSVDNTSISKPTIIDRGPNHLT